MRHSVFMYCLLIYVRSQLGLAMEISFGLRGFRHLLIWQCLTGFNLTVIGKKTREHCAWFREDRSVLEMKRKI